MKERNEQIKNFIKKYEGVLRAAGMDVAHSEFTDRWFIFKHNATFTPQYEFFIEVTSAEELENVILSELKFDMDHELGQEDVETPECEKQDISELVDSI